MSPHQILLRFAFASLLFTTASMLPAQGIYPSDKAYRNQFSERCETVRQIMARKAWFEGEDSRMRIYLGVVKLATGIDTETGLKYLEDAVNDSHQAWGCFETYPFMDGVLRLGDKLPPELVEKIHARLAASFTDDFGFTDNHMLQFRTARYLYGQTWPEGPNLADGSTPVEARQEAAAWIEHWIDATIARGMFEYDSPNYHHLYLLCFTSLYEYAQDEHIRQKAWMMMQVLLADWATEYLDGNWVGAHSREKYNQVLHTREHTGAATQFGRLFFGGAPLRLDLDESYFISLAALQEFQALPMLGNMATDRSHPYVLRELKAPRRGVNMVDRAPTWKYTYVEREFAVGSSWGDLTDVEQHRWDLTWVSPEDGSTCFFINPSYSAKQLVRYFDTPVDQIVADIVHQRPYYADPNKWIEGSPYEDVCQHENTVIAIYDIPPDASRQHINGFFPHLIKERREENGWILARADNIYFAVWTSAPGAWHPEKTYDRLTINHPKTAVILEAVAADQETSFDDFCARILASHPTFDEQWLTATYTSSRGHRMYFTHHGLRKVDGVITNLNTWPIFEGPWMNSIPGTGIVTLQYGREKYTFDFDAATVRPDGSKP
ncbi:MAG: hypothetical protein K9M98_02065 [Cephaloticoccus sp.]|nr:hypothetical protein [Cephaloticoccus sp.]MCF7759265.1 hypothetical protein [Cephaloticoccus sp.]